MNKFSTRPSREKMLHQLHRGNLHKHRSRLDSGLWMCTAMRYLSLMPTRFRNILIVIPVWSTFSLSSSTNLSYWSVLQARKLARAIHFNRGACCLRLCFPSWYVFHDWSILAGCISLYDPLNLKVCLTCLRWNLPQPTSFSRSLLLSYETSFFLSDLWPARFAFGP